MRLLLISSFPPTVGGVSEYAERTYRALMDLGVDVIKGEYKNPLQAFGIYKIFETKKPDAVRIEYNISSYGLGTIPLLLLAHYYKAIQGTKIFINYHEVTRETQALGLLGDIVYRILSLGIDGITVHTYGSKDHLIKRCGVNSSRIRVIPLGTLNKKFEITSRETALRKIDVENKPYVLFIGFVHIDKGIDVLIKAFGEIKNRFPDIYNKYQLLICGSIKKRSALFKIFENKDVRYYESLQKLALENCDLEKIKFIPYVADDVFSSLLANSDCVVLPYTKTEQSGVLNQALPLLVPIVASDIGGIGETLRDTGVLFPVGDYKALATNLNLVLTNTSYREKVITGYKKLNNDLSEVENGKQILNFYKELC